MSSPTTKNHTSRPSTSQPKKPERPKLGRRGAQALNRILTLDRESIARSGGPILQELGIRDPAHWAGSAGNLGERIRTEVLDDTHFKDRYVHVANFLAENSYMSDNIEYLSALILRAAAVNLLGKHPS